MRQVGQWKTRRGWAEGQVIQGGGIVGEVGRDGVDVVVDMMILRRVDE